MADERESDLRGRVGLSGEPAFEIAGALPEKRDDLLPAASFSANGTEVFFETRPTEKPTKATRTAAIETANGVSFMAIGLSRRQRTIPIPGIVWKNGAIPTPFNQHSAANLFRRVSLALQVAWNSNSRIPGCWICRHGRLLAGDKRKALSFMGNSGSHPAKLLASTPPTRKPFTANRRPACSSCIDFATPVVM